MHVTAIILSGGKGLRAGTKIPKQYMEIRGKTILGYTIDAFEKSRVDEIVIVAAEEYLDKCREIAEQCESRAGASQCESSADESSCESSAGESLCESSAGAGQCENGAGASQCESSAGESLCESNAGAGQCMRRKVTAVIAGGTERYYSVLNGLRYLTGRTSSAEFPDAKTCVSAGENRDQPGIVLIHDGARPFIRPAVINEIIRCVEAGTAAIAAAPCTDTIKIADADGCIVSTTDRAKTWAAQTPQAFRTEEIREAYEKIIGDKTRSLAGITDDAMVYQMAFPDKPVHLINAGTDNFKITTAEDLLRAESVIGG